MIPGKRYTPEVLLRIGWRHRWLIVVPLTLIASLTFAVSRYLPNRYRSETTILVVPQQIPEDYVRPTVTVRLEDRLASINQQILSRTRLEQIVREFNLYAEERQSLIMEDVIEQMRTRDIEIQTTPGSADRRQSAAPTFLISYTGSDARTVMRVTERLASLFIEENLRDRTALVEGTSQFLEAQLLDARNRLIEQEKRLETYRQQHAGELPSQLNTNMQAIQNIQLQIQTLTQSVSQDRDRRLMLDRLLTETATLVPPPPVVTKQMANDGPATLTLAQQLELARAELRALELRLKPRHPDIAGMRRTVAELERKAEAEALQQPLSPDSESAAAVSDPLEQQRQSRMRDMAAERSTLDRRIVEKEAEEKRLRDVLASYQVRIAAVPARETELVELTRDYETLREVYTNLLSKSENARAAANLERRQIGEQFKILDPARLPERPISPNRPQINSMGAIAGFAAGLGLVLLVEYRDRSFRTEADVLDALSLPVLALIPRMMSIAERRRRRVRRWLVRFALGAAIVALAFGILVILRLGLVARWL
jgi:polysaccharide chain length determinant protein (PEP-CTERM system associated)